MCHMQLFAFGFCFERYGRARNLFLKSCTVLVVILFHSCLIEQEFGYLVIKRRLPVKQMLLLLHILWLNLKLFFLLPF